MKYWLEKGIEELYFFMHMHDEAYSPELTVYMVDKLNKACGLDLIKPKFIEPAQTDLFGAINFLLQFPQPLNCASVSPLCANNLSHRGTEHGLT
jgi:hypothetical protein